MSFRTLRSFTVEWHHQEGEPMNWLRVSEQNLADFLKIVGGTLPRKLTVMLDEIVGIPMGVRSMPRSTEKES